MTLDTHNGVKVYTPTALKLYDWWVLNISNRYAWRCDTDKYLLPHFKNNLGENHMDIGVGTGFYLKRALANINKIALTDLNINSLDYAKKNHLILEDIAYDESLIDELTEANPQNYITQISVKFKKELE